MTQITITLPNDVTAALEKKALADGESVAGYIESLLKKQVIRPSIDEILSPFRQQFAESGMTEDELDEFVDEIREEIYQEKLAKQNEE
jgi:hypothetical protein